MAIFRGRKSFKTIGQRIKEAVEFVVKCLLLFLPAILLGAPVAWLWDRYSFHNGFHFDHKLEGIIAAWITTFGVLYALLYQVALSTVWDQYNRMRAAIKRYDLDTFMDLRDEGLSPLIHTLVAVVSSFLFLGFWVLEYPSEMAGVLVVGGVVFLLILMFVIVMEIDDPCAGLFFIRNIPEGWLDIEPKKYRAERTEEIRKELVKKHFFFRLRAAETAREKEG